MNIAIIGGGASGMAAALAALEDSKNHVVLYERQARLGKKLMATGNGRCNLTNQNPPEGHYHGGDTEFAAVALRRFGPARTLEWFGALGLLTVTEPSGRVYPASDAAASVLDCLRFALDERGAQVITEEIRFAAYTGRDFVLHGTDGEYRADRLIVACGGEAGAKLGGGSAGYRLLAAFGHGCTERTPSLVQLKTENQWTRPLKGVRTRGHVRLMRDDETLAESDGEVQFTDYGLSGPAIFDISRAAARAGSDAVVSIDLLPGLELVDITEYLMNKRSDFPNIKAENIFTGALHNTISRTLVRRAGIAQETRLWALDEGQIDALAALCKAFDFALGGTLGFDSAQVTAGGVVTDDFDPVTMESRLCPGLYACGEVLDVDGDCGGYNLQWAWSSGRAAGLAAGGVY